MTVDIIFDYFSELLADFIGTGPLLVMAMLLPCLLLFDCDAKFSGLGK